MSGSSRAWTSFDHARAVVVFDAVRNPHLAGRGEGHGELDKLGQEIESRVDECWESRVAAGSGERRRRWSAW